MAEKILEVAKVTLVIQKTNPPRLVINVKGIVRSGGWSNPDLSQIVHIVPPEDGIYQFDFVADAPTGIVTQALEEIEAEFVWEDFPTELKGVKISASSNSITENI